MKFRCESHSTANSSPDTSFYFSFTALSESPIVRMPFGKLYGYEVDSMRSDHTSKSNHHIG